MNILLYNDEIEPRNISAFVKTTVVNEAIDHRREDLRRGTPDDLDAHLDLSSSSSTPDKIVLDRDGIRQIQEAVELLPSHHREIIALAGWEYRNYEIAEIIGVPSGTVRSRYSRARNSLQKSLTSQNAGVSESATAVIDAADGSADGPQR